MGTEGNNANKQTCVESLNLPMGKGSPGENERTVP